MNPNPTANLNVWISEEALSERSEIICICNSVKAHFGIYTLEYGLIVIFKGFHGWCVLNGQFDANQGNTFPDVLDIGTPNNVHVWTFLQDVDGKIYGRVHLPSNLASSPAVKIILRIMANATTGVTRISVTHTDVNNGDNFNVAVTESIAAIDTTVPGTAFEAEDITFTLSTQPSADDTLDIEIFHVGIHANDTLAVDTLLVSARIEAVVKTVG